MSKKLGSKYMIIGESGSGKSTALSGLQDCFVVYADTKKRFPLKLPHTNVYGYKEFVTVIKGKKINNLPDKSIEYLGIANFQNSLITKLIAYKAVYKTLPKTVAFDAVTNIYKMIGDHIRTTTKNIYGSHSTDISKATDDFLSWVERELVGRGINVVFLAHSVLEEDRPRVGTSGSKTFEHTGGFYGIVNYASYIHVKEGIRLIAHKSLEFPHVCRSMLTDIEEEEDAESFDIQQMIDKIAENEQPDKFEI